MLKLNLMKNAFNFTNNSFESEKESLRDFFSLISTIKIAHMLKTSADSYLNLSRLISLNFKYVKMLFMHRIY